MFRKLKEFGKKPQADSVPTKTPVSHERSSTQSWLPIQDVYNGFIHRKDRSRIAAIRVQPINLNLLSENEKLRKIKSLEEVLNGIDFPFQMISLARPVDLDAYIASLDHLRQHIEDRIKSRLLNGYIKQAANMATSGEALERQFYILIHQSSSKHAQQDESILHRRALDLASSLSSSDLISHVCSDEELRDLLFIFTNPSYAAFERAPTTQAMFPTVFYQEVNP